MPGPLTEALDRWRKGDESAQYDLMRELHPLLHELVRLVRRHRGSDLRARIDSQGIVNAALKSFFSGARKGEFMILGNTQDVRRILYTLVLRTLDDELDWHHTWKRNPRLERSVDAVPDEELTARPEDVAGLADWVEAAMAVLRAVHPLAEAILELAMDGLSNNEIAGELALSLRTVQVIRNRMRHAWNESLSE